MTELKFFKTRTYDFGDGFLVDIVEREAGYEAWIYRNDFGVKELMFGEENNSDYSHFLETVECNAFDYKRLYDRQYS